MVDSRDQNINEGIETSELLSKSNKQRKPTDSKLFDQTEVKSVTKETLVHSALSHVLRFSFHDEIFPALDQKVQAKIFLRDIGV